MNDGQARECVVCAAVGLRTALAFGAQPPSNRFLAGDNNPQPVEERYPVSLGICAQCSTIQLVERMPLDAVRPRYDWLVYNEPEGHLDEVADTLSGLAGINRSSRFLGVTYKDKSTLDRMAAKGCMHTACVDEQGLNSPHAPFGLETIQDILSQPAAVARVKDIYGTADVLLARHIVEHAASASRFIKALRALLAPGGYMLLELPDSERVFRANNYPFIWEEHISYFTGASVAQLAAAVGAELVWLGRYPYAFEDSLIVVLRFPEGGAAQARCAGPRKDHAAEHMLAAFGNGFAAARQRWRQELQALRARGEKVAVFGAGHLAVKFINFFALADLIDCVIDDHPKKIGLRMPGSHLQIAASAALATRKIRTCISTLSPESELKAKAKLAGYFNAGGSFIPAFATG